MVRNAYQRTTNTFLKRAMDSLRLEEHYEALLLMQPGAQWKLSIAPQLAFELASRPPIPPGSMLIFEVELMSVKPAAAASPPAPAPK